MKKTSFFEVPIGTSGSSPVPICKEDEGGGDDYSEDSYPWSIL